ncbi:hypothetical protein EB093_08595 [bacterium]|nr:hypothetical protein [bacterium]
MFFVFVLVQVACYDIWTYFLHRLLHLPSFYFLHRIHHVVKHDELEYTDAHREHWVESFAKPVGLLIPCFLGHASAASLGATAAIIYVRGMMQHDRRFIWCVGNHHLLHHRYPKYNFGEEWVDFLFGSRYAPALH